MKTKLDIHKLDFLIAFYIFCIMIAELMGAKTFPIAKIGTFQLNASVAIFTLPLIFSINDIIIEVFCASRARSVVRTGIFCVALISIVAFIFTHLPPSTRFAVNEKAYDTIFGLTLRFSLASLTAFAVSDLLDVYIFTRLREAIGKKRLWLRTNLSNIIAQRVDTTLFITLAFYAIDKSLSSNVPFLLSIILPYWLLKCCMSVIETPLVYLGVKWLRGEKT